MECGSFSTPDVGCTAEKASAIAAYTDALIWVLTGDADYAAKSASIMDAWSSTITAHTLSNAPLQSAWVAEVFPRAACDYGCPMMLTRVLPRLAFVAFALMASGCSPTTTSAPPTTDSEHHHELHLPPVGPTIKISLEGKSVDVAVASVAHDGASVSLVDLWRAAWPAAEPTALRFDLTGSDGFHPTSRPRCPRLLTGAELGAARLDVVTHDVTFDKSVTLAGCYWVKAVVAIDGVR